MPEPVACSAQLQPQQLPCLPNPCQHPILSLCARTMHCGTPCTAWAGPPRPPQYIMLLLWHAGRRPVVKDSYILASCSYTCCSRCLLSGVQKGVRLPAAVYISWEPGEAGLTMILQDLRATPAPGSTVAPGSHGLRQGQFNVLTQQQVGPEAVQMALWVLHCSA